MFITVATVPDDGDELLKSGLRLVHLTLVTQARQTGHPCEHRSATHGTIK